ncbi:hypothetical protein ACEPAI_5009 [Sanghuangporus weigelae]
MTISVDVDVHPSSSTLCMINDPDTSTAYSLSGHVSISLSPDPSSSDRPLVEKVLLRSLTLTFEGQAELITQETGYSAVRLCRLKRDLAPAHALLLTNDGHEDSDTPSVWNFVFDLPIPGWLPSSSVYGNAMGGMTGTSYALYAEARFTPLEDGQHSRSWSLSSLCAPFIPRVRSISAPRREIEILRYTMPAITDDAHPSPSPTFRNLQYGIKARSDLSQGQPDRPRIPTNVFERIEVRALIPEYVDMETGNFTLALRLRSKGLSARQRQRLRLSQFRLSLEQHETYSRRVFGSYVSAYPLPSPQPDEEPLLNRHTLKGLFDMSLVSYNFLDGVHSRIRSSFSLLNEKQLARHELPCDGVSLQQDPEITHEQIWTRVDVRVPFERVQPGQDEEWEYQNGRLKALRPDGDSPFLRVYHDLEVELTFTYDGESPEDGSKPSVERMCFCLPVKFTRVPPVVKAQNAAELDLPAYSQLFHSNGERRIDNMAPLPAYSPPESLERTDCNRSETKY